MASGFRQRLRSTGRLLIPVAVVAGLAVLAAGCGSSSSSSTSSTTTTTTSTATTTTGASATDAWANGVCSAFATWKASITSALTSVQSNPSKDGLTSAANDAQSATETLASDLKGLGKPNTTAGQQAKTSLDQLSKTLTNDVNTIKTALSGASGASGLAGAVSVATTTLTAMGKEITSTVDDLKSLDAKGELEKAFTQSGTCSSLKK
jgi:hypothetical protein